MVLRWRGKGMSDVLVAGRASYEMLVRRPKSGALETQALAAGLLGADAQGEKPPVRLVCAKVRRGKNGLGLDLGHFNRVQSLVPAHPPPRICLYCPETLSPRLTGLSSAAEAYRRCSRPVGSSTAFCSCVPTASKRSSRHNRLLQQSRGSSPRTSLRSCLRTSLRRPSRSPSRH